MKKFLLVMIIAIILTVSLTACGGGDKKSSNTTVTVTEGDAASCIALRGDDVAGWTFTGLEKMSNNVCYMYQQQTVTR